MILFYTFN